MDIAVREGAGMQALLGVNGSDIALNLRPSLAPRRLGGQDACSERFII